MSLQDYIDHVNADSPLLYWPLVDDTNDASGNAKHPTIASGSGLVDTMATPCRGDAAFEIPTGSGGSQYASWTGALDTNAGNGLSVEFWLRVDGSAFVAGGPRVYSDTGTNKFEFTVGTTSGGVRFGTAGSTNRIDVASAMLLGYWYYWVFTQSSTGVSQVYKNGVQVGSTLTQTVGADFPDFKISNNAKTAIASRWQHVAVHNTELSASRIADRYAIQAEDRHSFMSVDKRPAKFSNSLPGLPYTHTTGSVTPTTGQLWPRGAP